MDSKNWDPHGPINLTGETWAKYFQHAFGGTQAKPVALELKQRPDGAVLARGIAVDGTVKIFRTSNDAERVCHDQDAKNYFEALERLDRLPRNKQMPIGLAATAFNLVRSLAPSPAARISRATIARRLADTLDLTGKRDRRLDNSNRALDSLLEAGHIHLRPTANAHDAIAVTLWDDPFTDVDNEDDWLAAE